MRRHFVLSWENVCVQRRWWACWAAHCSHRDVGHLVCNLSSFVLLGWAFQGALTALGLCALLLCVPLAASAASLGALLHAHGPAEALARWRSAGLVPRGPADFHAFCLLRWRDLRSACSAGPGLAAADVPLLVAQYRSYETWRREAGRGSLGLSAVTSSLAGFGALRLLHLRLSRRARHPALGLSLLLLLLPPGLELAELSGCGAAVSSTLRLRAHAPRAEDDVDAVGHLAGFACGALAYLSLLRRGA